MNHSQESLFVVLCLQDGGLINNNPTGIAINEARLLWPNDRIQCVVSLGTGRYEPSLEPELTSSGLRNKVNKFIQSATDTEGIVIWQTSDSIIVNI